MSDNINTPFYGWYGDDFTGATDTLATLVSRGAKAFLFLGVPSSRHLAMAGALDAVGVAGSARAMTPDAMEIELRPVGQFFARSGIKVLHYKCCSTFDSAKHVGNIATAMDVLRSFVDLRQVVILGGQPSLGRYCAFGNLFASIGPEAAVHRLDRHPTMSKHPSTPMAEADLRRHLQQLGADAVGLVDWTMLDNARPFVSDEPNILFDILTQKHLAVIGTELKHRARQGSLLAVGASSVAEAIYGDRSSPVNEPKPSATGPVLAIAGSLSPLTRRQVEAATSFVHISADAGRLVEEESYREGLATRIGSALRDERNVLLSTAPQDPASISSADTRLAQTVGRFADRLLSEVPVKRLIAAGGDTSSHMAQSLNLWGLSYGGQLSPGVALSIGRSDDPRRDGISMMLKGGQMGSVDLFDRFAGGVT